MNPVVGLDVAKSKSQIQMFLDKKTGMKPPVVLESTCYYHAPVIQFLEATEYIMIIVNPWLSYRAKSSSLRKTKTTTIDAYHLDEM